MRVYVWAECKCGAGVRADMLVRVCIDVRGVRVHENTYLKPSSEREETGAKHSPFTE